MLRSALLLAQLVLSSGFVAPHALADVVVYSEASSRIQKSITNAVIAGMRTGTRSTLRVIENQSPAKVLASIDSSDSLIYLGPEPFVFESLRVKLNPELRVYYGMSTQSLPFPGIGVTIYPGKLFTTLRIVSPNITSLSTVISDGYSEQHLSIIKSAAVKAGIDLKVQISSNATDTASLWQSLINNINPKSEALLVIDTAFMDQINAIRFILKESWQKSFITVTTIPKYTRQGVTVGVSLDLAVYGRSLIDYAAASRIEPELSRDYLPILHLRSLSHAGIYVKTIELDGEALFVE